MAVRISKPHLWPTEGDPVYPFAYMFQANDPKFPSSQKIMPTLQSRPKVSKRSVPVPMNARFTPIADIALTMSALGQKRTSMALESAVDYVVGNQQDVTIDRQSRSSCSFQVDDRLE